MKKSTKFFCSVFIIALIGLTAASCATGSDTTQSESESIEMLNSDPENFSVEVVSLTGNRASQKVSLEINFINHDVNKDVIINDFKAFNEEGICHANYFPLESFYAQTDTVVNAEWIVGYMVPSRNQKLSVISCKLNECLITLRKVKIKSR